jgi:hypothetical protein
LKKELPTSAFVPDITEENWAAFEAEVGPLPPSRRAAIMEAITEYALRRSRAPRTAAAADKTQRHETILRFGKSALKHEKDPKTIEERKSNAGRPRGPTEPHLDAFIFALIEAVYLDAGRSPSRKRFAYFLQHALTIVEPGRPIVTDWAWEQRVKRLLKEEKEDGEEAEPIQK